MDIDPRAFNVTLKAIATIHTPYESKFGVPRQSGVVNSLESTIVFAPEFRNKDALRGIEGYDYLWLIWSFSEAIRSDWSPTVRPAASRRKCAPWCFCDALAFPAKSPRAFFGAAFARGGARRVGERARC